MDWKSIAYVGRDDQFFQRLHTGVGGSPAHFDVYRVGFGRAKIKGRLAGAVLVVVDWDQMVEGEDHRLQRISAEEIWAVVKDLAQQGLRVALAGPECPHTLFLERALEEGADHVVSKTFDAGQLGCWVRRVLSLTAAWPSTISGRGLED